MQILYLILLGVVVHTSLAQFSPSEIIIEDSVFTTTRAVKVIPSQSDLTCQIKDVRFILTAVDVADIQLKFVALGGMRYNIINLVPGRNYQLKAAVIYKHCPADHLSKTHRFQTADDISVERNELTVQENGRVNISCTAEIGPSDKFTKRIEWRYAGRYAGLRMHDGIRSVRSRSHPNIAYLIIERASVDHAGEYMCIASPQAAIGSKNVTVIVINHNISKKEHHADFSKKTEAVSVTCSSISSKRNHLEWIDPHGSIIPVGNSQKYSVTVSPFGGILNITTLTIKDVSLLTSGIYQCRRPLFGMNFTKEFRLFWNENIVINGSKDVSVGSSVGLTPSSQDTPKKRQDQERIKPVMWSTSDGAIIRIHVLYAIESEMTFHHLEKSCANGWNSTVLATLTKDKCSFSDSRLSCTKYQNATLMTFTDDMNIAKEIKLRLTSQNHTIVDEILVKNEKTLAQNDVTIRSRFSDLSTSPSQQDINVVRVDVDVISRKVHDSIPCGTVKVRIVTATNKTGQETILQKPSFYINVEMRSKKENVTLIVSIDGVQGSHETTIQITDPKIVINRPKNVTVGSGVESKPLSQVNAKKGERSIFDSTRLMCATTLVITLLATLFC